jgi:ubiquinone/menaquinone biosynthesis C-methylase UbiE
MNAEKLDLIADNAYDRLTATCLIAHLANPEQALVEWRRVVKSGG